MCQHVSWMQQGWRAEELRRHFSPVLVLDLKNYVSRAMVFYPSGQC